MTPQRRENPLKRDLRHRRFFTSWTSSVLLLVVSSIPLGNVPAAASAGAGTQQDLQSPSSETVNAPQDAANPLATEGASSQASSVIFLEPGEIQSVPVDEIQRVAIGNPDVADVSVVSANEIFLQAKAVGSTNLILWDRKGQRVSTVEVVDRVPEALADQLRQLISQLNLPSVAVHREGNKLFLTGLVTRQEDLDRIEQLLTAFEGKVTNLVSLSATVPQGPPPPPLVKLTVQVLEMQRDETEKLGVDWADSVTFTETTFPAAAAVGPSLWKRAEDAFRIGAISRTGSGGALSAVLNFLVSNGKGRILSEPKLVAASGKEATAFLGVEVPVASATSVSSGTVTQSVEFKNTGMELKFKPTVLEGEHSPIQLTIDARVSSIDKSVGITVQGVLIPGFRIRKTQTEIVTNSGRPVVISGLLQDEEKKNMSQVPALGSVPVLGNLFRSHEFTSGRTELVIIVTPEVLGQEEQAAAHDTVLEEALSSAEMAAAVEDPSLRYAIQVQDLIAKSIRYPMVPEPQRGKSGRVKLRLHVFRDGTLGQAVLAESSGIESFDLEAMKAAESQSPYPPFPSGLVQPDLWMEVPVLFRP